MRSNAAGVCVASCGRCAHSQAAFWTMGIVLKRYRMGDNFLPVLAGVSKCFFQVTLAVSPGLAV